MRPPEIPHDDAARVAALRRLALLDTPVEERFDRLCRLAARTFGVPIAFVSFVDADRQWVKSAIGLERFQSSRHDSFCGHALFDDEAMVVRDARADERFHDNPFVTREPHIVFYAAQPLHDPVTRHRVGTLCLVDREPRSLTVEDRATLRDLAAYVERELAQDELLHVLGALEQSRARIEHESQRSARTHRELAATVNHELRTPLTAIRGSLGLLAGQVVAPLPDAAAELVKMAMDSTEQLVRLVEDVATLDRLDAGVIDLELTTTDTAALVRDAVAGVRAHAGRLNVQVDADVAAVPLRGDHHRLVHAIEHVLDNAVRFAAGHVTVSATKTATEVRISVSDDGPGIDGAAVDDVLEPFVQADRSDSREHGGIGVGLAVARGLVTAHGGGLSIESAPGAGTTCHIALPVLRSAAVLTGAGSAPMCTAAAVTEPRNRTEET